MPDHDLSAMLSDGTGRKARHYTLVAANTAGMLMLQIEIFSESAKTLENLAA
jgi:hypothetical protein